MTNKDTFHDRHLAAEFLRQLADSIERNDTNAFNAIGPALHALIFENRGPLVRPTPSPKKPTAPPAPVIFYDQDGPRPLNMVRRRVEYQDTTTGQSVSWPHAWQQLCKFARLPETRRIYWSGKTKIYGDALQHFAKFGFVVKHKNGWQWCRDFSPLQRRELALRWRPTTDTPAHAIPTHSPNRKS